MTGVLLDTSVVIADEQQRRLDRPLPDQAAVSVVTLAELELGVQLARSEEARARRMRTIMLIREQMTGLPIDQRVASAYAELVAAARRVGRRPRVNDSWIAATASVHGFAVWTQDEDFGRFEGIEVILV